MEARAGGPGTLATCWGGECSQAAIAAALNPARERRSAPRRSAFPSPRNDRPQPRPLGRPKAPRPLEGDSGRFSGGGRPNPAKPAPTPKTEAAGSPVSDERHPPRSRTPENGPDRAAALWKDSRPVPLDPAHPARLWAARRHLWPPDRPWPEAVRWLPWRDGGGSLVAAFAPVPDWRTGLPPTPSAVQLLHLAPDGSPQTDRGGLGKRSHGTMSAGVAVIGAPLWRAECVHVAEGIADALAIAAREDGPALAAGGTAGFRTLAPALARLGAPVIVWPDGDTPGRIAASHLVLALDARGAVASMADVPHGQDPASMAGPFTRKADP